MSNFATNRRGFLGAGVGLASLGMTRHAAAEASRSATRARRDGLTYASIGVGLQGKGLMRGAAYFATCAAICDADASHLRVAEKNLSDHYREKKLAAPRPDLCEDYRRVLDRRDIDVVVIATPDHWHTKIVIEALHAGKDVYCEKPLTLTVAEGRQILDALEATGRVMQVGTQQRSGKGFQTAAAMVRDGRVGKISRVTCSLDGAPGSPVLPVASPPAELNWNRWLGPAPYVPYRQGEAPNGGYGGQFPRSRAHAHFRWWYEYSGGKLTDWGAHHVDIAMWALNKQGCDLGPYRVEPMMAEHPVEFVDGMPAQDDRFNTATEFKIRVTFGDGTELDIRNSAVDDLGFRNGVMVQGDAGRFLVNRSKLVGKPVEELESAPLPESAYKALHLDAQPGGLWHMDNFFRSVRGETTPISDVASHHQHLTVCHVANLAIRLGRTLTFDPAAERFVGDEQADAMLERAPREGFEINA
ncbi:Gfo/Idh/MocA family protein [Botrimarina hoheduenensis]|nr:Gfo/Idh/MocA family oxidoreductase [Botrimarina hoheduenensis]